MDFETYARSKFRLTETVAAILRATIFRLSPYLPAPTAACEKPESLRGKLEGRGKLAFLDDDIKDLAGCRLIYTNSDVSRYDAVVLGQFRR